jgi:hypothetical protein
MCPLSIIGGRRSFFLRPRFCNIPLEFVHRCEHLIVVNRGLRHHPRVLPACRYHILPRHPPAPLLPQPRLPPVLHHHRHRNGMRNDCDHMVVWQFMESVGASVQDRDTATACSVLCRADSW